MASTILIPIIIFTNHKISNRVKNYNKYKEPMGNTEFNQNIINKLENGTTIISDMYTSYHLPSLIDVDIISASKNHVNPSIDIDTRIQDNHQFFSPTVPIEYKLELIKKYNIKYILTNNSILNNVSFPYSKQLLKTNNYPNWSQTKDNISLYEIDDNLRYKSYFDTIKYQPVFSNSLLVFPKPIKIAEKKLTWKHSGQVTIFTKENITIDISENIYNYFSIFKNDTLITDSFTSELDNKSINIQSGCSFFYFLIV